MATEAPSLADYNYRRYVDSRLLSLRDARYSWWTHARELADYFLPRRYKWLVTANQNNRGSPINQHIIDSTGVICARNLAAGLLIGKTPPNAPWVYLRVNRQDSTGTNPTSLWLAECERLLTLVFSESNFYPAMGTFMFDLVIFGTAVMLIYEDFDNVINCFNPCFGEYYVDIDGKYRPCIFYREFTMTIGAIVNEFGIENCPPSIADAYNRSAPDLAREMILAHAIEPNDDGGRDSGVSDRFTYREVYWVWGSANGPESGPERGFLRKRGYYEKIAMIGRWDLVSNDPYGRSPAMDALGDQKQLQLETRRKAQAIEKGVNPPLIGDAMLKNKPASQLPGGITWVQGFSRERPGLASIYQSQFNIGELTQDLAEIRDRLSKIFFNDVLRPISQYETRSNVTAVEVDQRKAESLIMLGPVFERLDCEVLRPIVERVFAIMTRAGIIPPAPPEIAGHDITVEFESMLAKAQSATAAASIERVLGMVGNIIGVDPQAGDKVDWDYALDKYSSLLDNDPKMMRTDAAVAAIRQNREAQQQAQAKAEQAQMLSKSAANLAGADTQSPNALTALLQGGQGG